MNANKKTVNDPDDAKLTTREKEWPPQDIDRILTVSTSLLIIVLVLALDFAILSFKATP